MNKHFIPKTEFTVLLASSKSDNKQKENDRIKLWFNIADRILRDWNGVSYSFLKSLTPGQSALVCIAQFHRGAAHDLISSITESQLPSLTLKAFETIQAHEYLELLKTVEAVFPGKKFPEYAEDVLAALRKQPTDYFKIVADSFVAGKGMRQPLYDYVFEYVSTHPEDFCIV